GEGGGPDTGSPGQPSGGPGNVPRFFKVPGGPYESGREIPGEVSLHEAQRNVPGSMSLSDVASSPWFGLISGLASILGLLIALYGTQVRTLPFSLYRSLVWQRALILSFGIGTILFSCISFYNQDPPPGVIALRQLYFWLHYGDFGFHYGDHEFNDFGNGTSLWFVTFIIGAVTVIWGFVYDPFEVVRNKLFEEGRLLQEVRKTQIERLLGNSSLEQLGSHGRQQYFDILNFYSQIQTRIVDALFGPSPTVIYHRNILNESIPLEEKLKNGES
ncbi:MAG: hypothetical protein L7F78_11900, partial [Syntrophales bacterium LBB04]|nr:hypothetical protein [Syntrophales bacterium LBB04]